LETDINSQIKINFVETMFSHPTYRQLVLFDGTDDRGNVLKNVKDLSEIPSNCDFRIFCNESNTTIEKSLKDFKIPSHVKVYKSSDPAAQMSDILNQNICKCSFILVIWDELAICKFKWSKTKEVQMNTSITQNNPSDVTVKSILDKLHRHAREENTNALVPIDSQLFPSHQCPLCSQSFHLNNDLREHCENEHISITLDDIDADYFATITFNKRSHPEDRYKMELHCMLCNHGFQTLGARYNHQKKKHKGASANN
jgi:hypothetical protein